MLFLFFSLLQFADVITRATFKNGLFLIFLIMRKNVSRRSFRLNVCTAFFVKNLSLIWHHMNSPPATLINGKNISMTEESYEGSDLRSKRIVNICVTL